MNSNQLSFIKDDGLDVLGISPNILLNRLNHLAKSNSAVRIASKINRAYHGKNKRQALRAINLAKRGRYGHKQSRRILSALRSYTRANGAVRDRVKLSGNENTTVYFDYDKVLDKIRDMAEDDRSRFKGEQVQLIQANKMKQLIRNAINDAKTGKYGQIGNEMLATISAYAKVERIEKEQEEQEEQEELMDYDEDDYLDEDDYKIGGKASKRGLHKGRVMAKKHKMWKTRKKMGNKGWKWVVKQLIKKGISKKVAKKVVSNRKSHRKKRKKKKTLKYIKIARTVNKVVGTAAALVATVYPPAGAIAAAALAAEKGLAMAEKHVNIIDDPKKLIENPDILIEAAEKFGPENVKNGIKLVKSAKELDLKAFKKIDAIKKLAAEGNSEAQKALATLKVAQDIQKVAKAAATAEFKMKVKIDIPDTPGIPDAPGSPGETETPRMFIPETMTEQTRILKDGRFAQPILVKLVV